MSKNLQHFVNNFVTGMELGNRMQDRWANQQHRKDVLAVSRSNAELAARRHAERMALDTQKLGIYKTGVDARAARDMAAAAKAGRAGAGGAPGLTPEQEEFYRAAGLPGPMSQVTPQINVRAEAPEDNTPVERPETTYEPEPIGAARGGRMPPRMDAGTSGPGSGYGAIATKPPQYAGGGLVRRYDYGGEVLPPYERPYYSRDAYPWQGPDPATGRPPDEYIPDRRYPTSPPMNRDQSPDRYYPEDTGYEGREAVRGMERRIPPEDSPPLTGREFPYVYPPNPYTGPLNPQEGQSRPSRPTTHGKPRATPRRGVEDVGLAEEPGAPPDFRNPLDSWKGDRQDGFVGEEARADERGGGPRRPPPFVGEEARADESGRRPMPNLPTTRYDPSDYEGGPRAPQTMPAVTVTGSAGGDRIGGGTGRGGGGGGGGGGRGAISTGWKPLRDQTREKAFDPAERDRFDPDNVHAVDQSGAALSAATGYADRVFHQGKEQGKIQGQQTGGEGAPMDPRTVRGKHALYGGAGAADPKLMEQIFQKVDPENRMSMDQKMMAAVKNVNDFYMGQGDKENAAKSAFEVSQFAVQMSKQHGAEAIKQMQAGNMQGAVDTMIKGYNFLPDGNTASVQGNNLVITSEGGQQVASYALDERGIKNIALGMATGQLGWDVIRMGAQGGAGAPPAGGPPPAAAPPPVQQAQVAAQPSAAPAGPSQTPAAASPPPAPGATVAPAAPSAPRASPPAPSGSAPARPSAPTPATASAPAAAARPAGETAIKAQPPLPAQGDNIPGSAVADPDPEKQAHEHFKKDPYAPLPEHDDSATVAQIRKQVAEAEARHNVARAEYIAWGKRIGIKQSGITYAVNHLDKQFHDQKKAIEAKLETQRKERREDKKGAAANIKPRDYTRADEEDAAAQIKKRFKEIETDAGRSVRSGGEEEKASARRKGAHANSVLRYAKDDRDIEPLVAVARGIWRNNRDVTEADAADIARGVTSIVPKDGGLNLQTGEKATQFRPKVNPRDEITLLLPDGRSIHVDNNTYVRIKDLHRQNWKDYAKTKDEADKQGKQDERAKSGAIDLMRTFAPTGGAATSGR
jgi:hypothetical protein